MVYWACYGGLVLALSTWAKIDSAIDARINTVVAPALTNAQIRIDTLSLGFQRKVDELKSRAVRQSSDLEQAYVRYGGALQKVQASGMTNFSPEIDLSGSIGPIQDQGNVSSSVGYAFAYRASPEPGMG